MRLDNIAGRPKFRWTRAKMTRVGGRALDATSLPVVRGDLGDELLEDGVGKRLEALRGNHEGARPADHAVVVIAVEIRLEREDRQAVDADAGGNRFVAGLRDRATPVVGAVA